MAKGFRAYITIQVLTALIALALGSPAGCSKETEATKIKSNFNDNSAPEDSGNQSGETNDGTSSITEDDGEEIEGEVTASSNGAENAGSVSLNGSAIYAEKCAGCHGDVSSSSKRNSSVGEIAGSQNIAPHRNIAWPNSAEIQAIADALAQ